MERENSLPFSVMYLYFMLWVMVATILFAFDKFGYGIWCLIMSMYWIICRVIEYTKDNKILIQLKGRTKNERNTRRFRNRNR